MHRGYQGGTTIKSKNSNVHYFYAKYHIDALQDTYNINLKLKTQ